MSAAERQRRFRARVRRGEEVLRIPVQSDAIVEALLERQRLTAEDALDRRKVEKAVAAVLAEWAGQRSA